MTLCEEHFPQSAETEDEPKCTTDPDRIKENQELAEKIFDSARMKRLVDRLPMNKTPGIDNIRNSMIKAAWDLLAHPLTHIFKQCIIYNYCPKEWKLSKGIIIPKQGKEDYTNPRAFRIISLTSNLQKLLERALLDYLERDVRIDNKLTKNQFGFRKRKSTEAAIHKLTRRIEDAIQHGQIGLGIFLDVEGAFDNIKYSSIHKALEDAKIPSGIADWIKTMLSDRTITIQLHGLSITRKISKGCPQGGILSPLLWNLTLNMLLANPNLDTDFIQAFADDLAVLIQGFDLNETMRSIAIRYLKTIDKWCTDNGLKLSTLKTKIIIFSTINKKLHMKPICINNQTIEVSEEIKYLGITYDKHLRWTTHIKNKCNAATKLLHMCRNYIAKEWGLTPSRARWIYKQVVLPTLSYACFVWIHQVDKINYIKDMLNKVQKMASLQITGGFKRSPNITLDVLAGIMPISTHLEFRATLTTIRLKTHNNWHGNYSISSKIISHAHFMDKHIEKLHLTNLLPLLDTLPITNINKEYSVSLELPQDLPETARYDIFTDGSLQKREKTNLTGAGFTISTNGNTVAETSISLGQQATINQCEMMAIYRAAETMLGLSPRNEVVNFYSDSLSTLIGLNNDSTKSKLTLDTNLMLNALGKQNKITLYKVKAHTGITGNERADELAKIAANNNPIGPEPFLYISWSTIIDRLNEYSKQSTIKTINDQVMKTSKKHF